MDSVQVLQLHVAKSKLAFYENNVISIPKVYNNRKGVVKANEFIQLLLHIL